MFWAQIWVPGLHLFMAVIMVVVLVVLALSDDLVLQWFCGAADELLGEGCVIKFTMSKFTHSDKRFNCSN